MRLVDSLRSVVYLGASPFPPVAVRGKTNGCSAPVVTDAAQEPPHVLHSLRSTYLLNPLTAVAANDKVVDKDR
jgi:hypothetical protein